MFSVWIENRAGDLRPCNYVDFQDFYASKGYDFDWTVSEDRFSEDVNRVLSTASQLLSGDLRTYWEDDEWPCLKDTDLSETDAEELAGRIASMPNKQLADADGQSLLCHAVRAARPDLVSVALKAGVKGEALHLAAKLEGVEEDVIIEILDLLLASGGALNDESVFCESPLEIAALRQQFKVVRYLLEKGGKRARPWLNYHPAIQQVLSSALSDFRAHSRLT